MVLKSQKSLLLLEHTVEQNNITNTEGTSGSPARKTRRQGFPIGYISWFLMEKILRNFKEWQRVYETKGNPELDFPNKITLNILDFDLKVSFQLLSDAQKEAITLICLENRREIEAAQLMGFNKYSSQVGFLKRQGLKILADYYNELLGFDTTGEEYL
jgi:hypothetical protein